MSSDLQQRNALEGVCANIRATSKATPLRSLSSSSSPRQPHEGDTAATTTCEYVHTYYYYPDADGSIDAASDVTAAVAVDAASGGGTITFSTDSVVAADAQHGRRHATTPPPRMSTQTRATAAAAATMTMSSSNNSSTLATVSSTLCTPAYAPLAQLLDGDDTPLARHTHIVAAPPATTPPPPPHARVRGGGGDKVIDTRDNSDKRSSGGSSACSESEAVVAAAAAAVLPAHVAHTHASLRALGLRAHAYEMCVTALHARAEALARDAHLAAAAAAEEQERLATVRASTRRLLEKAHARDALCMLRDMCAERRARAHVLKLQRRTLEHLWQQLQLLDTVTMPNTHATQEEEQEEEGQDEDDADADGEDNDSDNNTTRTAAAAITLPAEAARTDVAQPTTPSCVFATFLRDMLREVDTLLSICIQQPAPPPSVTSAAAAFDREGSSECRRSTSASHITTTAPTTAPPATAADTLLTTTAAAATTPAPSLTRRSRSRQPDEELPLSCALRAGATLRTQSHNDKDNNNKNNHNSNDKSTDTDSKGSAHPATAGYFAFFGGATEEHLSARPLSTFLSCASRLARAAHAHETLIRLRARDVATPATAWTAMTDATATTANAATTTTGQTSGESLHDDSDNNNEEDGEEADVWAVSSMSRRSANTTIPPPPRATQRHSGGDVALTAATRTTVANDVAAAAAAAAADEEEDAAAAATAATVAQMTARATTLQSCGTRSLRDVSERLDAEQLRVQRAYTAAAHALTAQRRARVCALRRAYVHQWRPVMLAQVRAHTATQLRLVRALAELGVTHVVVQWQHEDDNDDDSDGKDSDKDDDGANTDACTQRAHCVQEVAVYVSETMRRMHAHDADASLPRLSLQSWVSSSSTTPRSSTGRLVHTTTKEGAADNVDVVGGGGGTEADNNRAAATLSCSTRRRASYHDGRDYHRRCCRTRSNSNKSSSLTVRYSDADDEQEDGDKHTMAPSSLRSVVPRTRVATTTTAPVDDESRTRHDCVTRRQGRRAATTHAQPSPLLRRHSLPMCAVVRERRTRVSLSQPQQRQQQQSRSDEARALLCGDDAAATNALLASGAVCVRVCFAGAVAQRVRSAVVLDTARQRALWQLRESLAHVEEACFVQRTRAQELAEQYEEQRLRNAARVREAAERVCKEKTYVQLLQDEHTNWLSVRSHLRKLTTTTPPAQEQQQEAVQDEKCEREQ